MSERADVPWHQPPPRGAAVARRMMGRIRGYWFFAGLIAATVFGVPALVGATSAPGERWDAFLQGLALLTVMFGLPCAAFVWINIGHVWMLARRGVACAGVVTAYRPQTGRAPALLTVSFSRPGDTTPCSVVVHGILGQPGQAATVLVAPEKPKVAGVVTPLGDVVVGRAR